MAKRTIFLLIDVLLSGAVEFDQFGKMVCSFNSGIDQTGREANKVGFAEDQQMNASGDLTDRLPHEFNNLLTIILGNLRLLERSLRGDEQLSKQINSAIVATRRAMELTKVLESNSHEPALDAEPDFR